MKDTLIIEHLRRGDEEAFKYIYERHYVLLCRFANQILNDAALSEEVVDDAIFYLWEHRREIEITYSVRAYLMRAVRNRCLNELQSFGVIVRNCISHLLCYRKIWIFLILFLWKRISPWVYCSNGSWKMS